MGKGYFLFLTSDLWEYFHIYSYLKQNTIPLQELESRILILEGKNIYFAFTCTCQQNPNPILPNIVIPSINVHWAPTTCHAFTLPGLEIQQKTKQIKNPCSQGTDILGGRKSGSKLEIPKGLLTLNIVIYTCIE